MGVQRMSKRHCPRILRYGRALLGDSFPDAFWSDAEADDLSMKTPGAGDTSLLSRNPKRHTSRDFVLPTRANYQLHTTHNRLATKAASVGFKATHKHTSLDLYVYFFHGADYVKWPRYCNHMQEYGSHGTIGAHDK